MSVGTKLYACVLSIFILFAVAFIVFQQAREKQYKIDTLNLKLQDYNAHLEENLHEDGIVDETRLNAYVARHSMPDLRVTIITHEGKVVYDNRLKDYSKMNNHSTRPEIAHALTHGTGSVVDRNSATLNKEFFYSATYFPGDSLIVRSALPYNNTLSKSLRADQHYIWFALTSIILLTLILYRFTRRLDGNINRLRIFASRADLGETLETEDLVRFSDDELGEIAERIIKIYKRLQTTRREQDILKRQLTQNIAHELKTPVASIQGYLETIIENPRIDDATKAQFLQRCYAQSQRLGSLLQDISTLNRMDDAPDLLVLEPININAIVDNIMKETALQLTQKGMMFRTSLPDNVNIKGNPSLVYSIFRNLTDNAIAYAGDGTTISLKAQNDADSWQFTFSDNGIGVPSEHLPRLFERFYRVDKGRSRKMGGTGLGLAIVKNAVFLHGGKISVHNNIDGGLRFEFSLKKQG